MFEHNQQGSDHMINMGYRQALSKRELTLAFNSSCSILGSLRVDLATSATFWLISYAQFFSNLRAW